MEDKLKVAFVITRMDWGGSPDIVRILCAGLNRSRFDVTLVIGKSEHASLKTNDFFGQGSVGVKRIPELVRNLCPVRDSIAFYKLYRYFRREKFDIVHTHTAKSGLLGRVAARLAGVKIVVHTPHGHNFYGYFNRYLTALIIIVEKWATGFTDKIVVLTELEKRDYLTFKVAAADKLVLINQGLELEIYAASFDRDAVRKNLGFSSQDKVVGFVGRLEPVKGPQILIDALPAIVKKFSAVKFIFAGEGSLRSDLEVKVRSCGLADKVMFLGWREDVPALLHALDLLVVPSLNEAVGIILIEAQAAGLAVVASDVGGIPEVVIDRKTGILVPASSSEALADAIGALLLDDSVRLRMGLAGKVWVQGKFQADEMIAKVEGLYEELWREKK